MDNAMPSVSRYLLEEVGAICQGSSSDLGAGDAARIATEINALFRVRLTAEDLSGVHTVAEVCALLQTALAGPPPTAAEPAPSGPGAAPLSSAQQRIWFVQQLAGDAVLYNVPVRLELAGPVDEAALHAALADVRAAHEILRTVYPTEGGIPLAQVSTPAGLPLIPTVDLSAEADPAAALDRLASCQAAIPFRLDQEPPVRLVMARRSRHRLVLIATFHHIAVDWVTVNNLVSDLGARYTAHVRRSGEPAEVPERVYSDVARWESSPEGSAALGRAVADRTVVLAGVSPVRLPTDLPRPRFTRFAGAAVHSSLEAPAVAAVRRLARQCRVTPFAILMAAFVVVLSRASRQPEFLVGTPASGRVRAEWQDIAGCFVNVVPVVVRPGAAPTGAELVSHVSRAVWQALDAQDAPFDRLVRARGLRAEPLASVLFSYQPNSPLVPFHGLADTAPEFSSPPGTAKYDLSLYAAGRGPGLRLELEYDVDVYAPETAAAVLGAYEDALRSLVLDPDAPVDLLAPSGFEAVGRRTQERSAGFDRAAS
jgi:hypothetical protein